MKKSLIVFIILICSKQLLFAQTPDNNGSLEQKINETDVELQWLVNKKKTPEIKEVKRTTFLKEFIWLGAASITAYKGVQLENEGKVVLGNDLKLFAGIAYGAHLTQMLTKNTQPRYKKQKVKSNTPGQLITPPILAISDIEFRDYNKNGRVDADENCSINFIIRNTGKGVAYNLKSTIINNSLIKGLDFDNVIVLNNMSPNSIQKVSIPLKGNMDLTSGLAKFTISFEEKLGFPPDKIEIEFNTKEFISPSIKVVDYSFITKEGVIKLGSPIQLKVIVQNVGQGIASNVNVNFIHPSINVFLNGPNEFEIGELEPNEQSEIIFEFFPNKLYNDKTIPIGVIATEKYKKFGDDKSYYAIINEKSTSNAIKIASNAIDKQVKIEMASLSSDVDKNIPDNEQVYLNKYALIIGNEDYSSKQTGLNSEDNVPFAINDAQVFKDYVIKTLGVSESNCIYLINSTAGEMSREIERVSKILNKLGDQGELIFYYAGHGFPDEFTKSSYLIPVDVSATNLNSAIKLSDLYDKFSQTKAKKVTFFLDACFTGAGRQQGLLATRGIKIKPKQESFSGNMVVFTATSDEQTAWPYADKKHGMFTYYLLKKLQDSKGNITYGELQKYISDNVSIQSLKINQKEQEPKIFVSPSVESVYENWRLR